MPPPPRGTKPVAETPPPPSRAAKGEPPAESRRPPPAPSGSEPSVEVKDTAPEPHRHDAATNIQNAPFPTVPVADPPYHSPPETARTETPEENPPSGVAVLVAMPFFPVSLPSEDWPAAIRRTEPRNHENGRGGERGSDVVLRVLCPERDGSLFRQPTATGQEDLQGSRAATIS